LGDLDEEDVWWKGSGTTTSTDTNTIGMVRVASRSAPRADPVGAGYVDSLARPGGNVTGFLQFEYVIAGKWLELLKQIAPALTRAAVIRDANTSTGIAQWAVIQAMAPSIGVELSLINMRDASSIEPDIAAVAHSPNSGLIVTGATAYRYRVLITKLAADHKLPAIL
jgi:putative ABC transport system substrate-binding protein